MKKGFTLLELLLVVSVILILLGLTTVIVKKAIEAGQKAERKTALENVQAALTAYRHHYGHFPEVGNQNSVSVRYVDGTSHKWYKAKSSFAHTDESGSGAYTTVSTQDSAELFFALEGEGSAENPEKIQFIDSSILYTLYNGSVITLKAARDKGASSALRLGVMDNAAEDGIAWFGVSLRLDADKAYVSLPTKDGSEWVYNSERYDD